MAEGIMSLPESTEAPTEPSMPPVPPEEIKKFESALREYATQDPQRFGQDLLDSIGQSEPQLIAQLETALANASLPDDAIDALGQLMDILSSDPENYEENRQDAIYEGIPSELMPETYDPAFFTAMNIALDKLSQKNSERPEIPPMEFSDGGIATLKPLAAAIAAQGRGTDTMLAHITPSEARMLRRNGGSGTINPNTGLPEFGFFSDMFKGIKKAVKAVVGVVKKVVTGVVKVVKKVASNPIGKAVLTIGATMLLGPGSALFGGAGLAGSIGLAAMPNAALAFNTFAASTLVNLASGQKFGDALKGGLLTGATVGIGSKVLNLTPEAYTKAAEAAKGSAAVKTAGLGESYAGDMPSASPLSEEGANQAITSAKASVPEAATRATDIAAKVGSPTTATKVAEQSWLGKTFGKPGEWINENIMPSGIKQQGEIAASEAATSAYGNAIANNMGSDVAASLAKKAYDAATPGFLRTYGPLAAVGIGGAYLAGAFDQNPEDTQPPPGYEGMIDKDYVGKTGYELLEENPEKWGLNAGEFSTSYSNIDPYASNYLAQGGQPKHFPRKTGPINGPGSGTSDSIPAMLSDGEFVFTAKAVRGAGDGSRRIGAARMYAMMKALEKNHGG
jgi:hypothetical protein